MSEIPESRKLRLRTADVGGIPILRALPQRGLRKVGAWCFLDHAGPADPPPPGMQVGPHPHLGLQTFTWMIRGEVLHRDSLGNTQLIRPGQVNLMTAGHGITHSEESQTPSHIHAAQLWIALPESERHCPPRFEHHPLLPQTRIGGFTATVLAGQALGLQSPARVHTPLMGVDLQAGAQHGPETGLASACMPLLAGFEHAALLLEGEVHVQGQALAMQELLYLPPGMTQIDIRASPGSRLLVIGGEPMQETLILWWNFVARSSEEIAEARAQWEAEAQSYAGSPWPEQARRRFGPMLDSPLAALHAPSLEGVVLRAS
ncbi:pirin family protein [Comamonas composti]|uniref:pirin family protein n=1 Tax=Comamonas composti TaxID=408558 RepID=UPI0003FA8A0C|nr:pirin family protein [Comamonas composti]